MTPELMKDLISHGVQLSLQVIGGERAERQTMRTDASSDLKDMMLSAGQERQERSKATDAYNMEMARLAKERDVEMHQITMHQMGITFGKAPDEVTMEDISVQVKHAGKHLTSTSEQLTSSAFAVDPTLICNVLRTQNEILGSSPDCATIFTSSDMIDEVAATVFGDVDGASRLCSRILARTRVAIKEMGMSCYDGRDAKDGRCRNPIVTKRHLAIYSHFLELCEMYLSAAPFEAQSDDAPPEAQSGDAPPEAQSGTAPPEAQSNAAPSEAQYDAAPSEAPPMTPMIMTPPPHSPPTPTISQAMERVTISSGYDVKLQDWKALHCNPSYSPAKMHIPELLNMTAV